MTKSHNFKDIRTHYNGWCDLTDPNIEEVLYFFKAMDLSSRSAEWYVTTSIKSSIVNESRRFDNTRCNVISIPDRRNPDTAEQIHLFLAKSLLLSIHSSQFEMNKCFKDSLINENRTTSGNIVSLYYSIIEKLIVQLFASVAGYKG
jgi:hypothetical protein